MATLDVGSTFQVNPFVPPVDPGLNFQPFFWTGGYTWGGSLKWLCFTSGFHLKDSSRWEATKSLSFSVTHDETPECKPVWIFRSLTRQHLPQSSLSYPRAEVENELMGHADPMLGAHLASTLEVWHCAMVEAAKTTAKIHDRHPHFLENEALGRWLRNHNGHLAMGQPQHRSSVVNQIFSDARR